MSDHTPDEFVRRRSQSPRTALNRGDFGESVSARGRLPAKPARREPAAYLLPERPRLDAGGNLITRRLAAKARCPTCEQLVTEAPCLLCWVRGNG